MKQLVLVSLALFAVSAAALEGRAQTVIYTQPNDNPDGPYSDGVPGQFWSTRIADDFVLGDPDNRQIVEITWWGSPEGMVHFELTNWTDWVIWFYRDDEGLPGEEIFAATVPIEQTNPIWTGNYNMNGAGEYEQSAQFADGPTLFIDEVYWVSIGAVAVSPQDDGWVWSLNYFEGNNAAGADYFDDTGYHPITGDVAFTLWGDNDPDSCCPRRGDPSGNGCLADIFPNNGDGQWDCDDDGDCVVNLDDLAQLLGHYGMTSGASREDGDIYPQGGDGRVNLDDLAEMVGRYGHDCRY